MTGKRGLDHEVRGQVDAEKVQFGQVAINLGYITEKQLHIALTLQEKIRTSNREAPALGEILIQNGYLTEEQRRKVYEKQGKLGGHTHIPGYALKEQIGSGVMGTVYKALQVDMKRVVAIKVLAPRLAINDQLTHRFIDEGTSVAQLNHPHIVQGIDAGAVNGVHYFVMEFMNGPTVRSLIDHQGPLSCPSALSLTRTITDALEHAHKMDLVHRNVKPGNMMLNGDGVVKLCDLGMASVVSSRERENVDLGTPHYVSPEQALRSDDLNIQTDIYSLGASLYHMLTGEVPYPGENTKEVMRKHVQASLTPPSAEREDISDQLDDLVLTMMSKDRDQRHQGPGELKDHIDKVRSSEDKTSASDTSARGPTRRRLRLRRGR